MRCSSRAARERELYNIHDAVQVVFRRRKYGAKGVYMYTTLFIRSISVLYTSRNNNPNKFVYSACILYASPTHDDVITFYIWKTSIANLKCICAEKVTKISLNICSIWCAINYIINFLPSKMHHRQNTLQHWPADILLPL